MRQLCDDVLSLQSTVYGKEYMRAAHASRMLEGLDAMNTQRTYIQLYLPDVKIEKFTFEFTEEYSCDTGFVIGFGDRLYRSAFSDWSNDLNILRHELEGLILRKEGSIELHYEDEPNIIHVKGLYFCNHTKDYPYVEVTFTPDNFVGGPIMFGYCKRREVIERLYYGFMELFSRDTNWFDNEYYEPVSWEEFRTKAIAQLKSPIIEDYLNKFK